MARCPHCNEILDDAWLRMVGATLMGKAKGENKARDPEQASAAANKRWTLHDELAKTRDENIRLREQLGKEPLPPAKKKKKISN